MQYIQTYFECFRDSGMKTVFQVFRMRENEKIEAIPFDHVHYDGVSALTELARKFPAKGFMAPALTLKPKPTILKRLYELMKWYVRFYPFMPSKWKSFSGDEKEITTAITQVANWKSADSKISINTKLLFALDQTSRKYLLNSKPRVWMSPVGLYNQVTRDIVPANRVSFIDLKVGNDNSLSDVQEEAKSQLKNLNYWGTILTMYISVFFGKWFFTKFAKYVHLTFRRTGTFSNMGEWAIPGIPADEWWVFGEGCVAKMSPVEGTAIVINGRMGLSVHFHPSLGFNNDRAQNFINEWKESFLKLNQ